MVFFYVVNLNYVDIHDAKDWQLVSIAQVKKAGGYGLINYYKGSLRRALQTLYPQLNWNEKRRRRGKIQHLLWHYIKQVRLMRTQYGMKNDLKILFVSC